jgi:DNA modification methylase
MAGCPKGGIVLDPFVGSGTTMKVAKDLGRSAVGIELNANYVQIVKKRLGWGMSIPDSIEWDFKVV